MTTNPRDTQFLGFAQLLIPEIDEVIGAVTEWGVEHDIDDEAKVAQELYSRWRTLIAQRAYDLACHVATTTLTVAHGDMSKIPDLTQWPEESK